MKFFHEYLTAKNHQLISQKSSILDVRLGSKYILSIELLLDRFGQSNKFQKKSKKKFRDIQQMTKHRPLGCVLQVLSDTYPVWSNRIFLGNVPATLEEDVLATSRKPIFADWVGQKMLKCLRFC